MSQVHTTIPLPTTGHRGESDFARWLADIGNDRLHLWFGVDYLPGVSDLDIFACHEDIGFFAIEVKAVALDGIEEYGPGLCKLRGRTSHLTPLQQARKAQLKLSEYLRDVAGIARPPFIHVTAAWPRIARMTFTERWSQPAVVAQAKSMLFNDELQSVDALETLLRYITLHPAMGASLDRPRAVSSADLAKVVEALAPGSTQPASATDEARIQVIEERVRTNVRSSHPPGQSSQVLFRGAPGTGKTFRLLEIALAHAQADRAVLFACYNKVLGSDLRRLLHSSPSFRAVSSLIDVVDIEQLVQRYCTIPFGGDYDQSRSEEVATLRRMLPLENGFDTLLVDEAQDLRQWGFELLDWVAKPAADWYVAEGRGQSLYDDESSEWLRQYGERAKMEQLRRVFRTARTDFLVAQCLHELSPDRDRIDAWLAGKMPSASDATQLSLDLTEDFERPGQVPHLVNLRGDPVTAGKGWREAVVAEYGRVIQEELRRLEVLGSPHDLAILVPGPPSGRRTEAAWVVDALKQLDVPFLDQADEEQRRQLLHRETVRVVTYHSARGIEAGRCLVFGFEALDRMGPEVRQRNLGYIALSRARHGTTIALSPYASGAHVDFLKTVVTRITTNKDVDEQSTTISDVRQANAPPPDWRSGAISRLRLDKGFGFLTDDATREEVFFHVRSLFGLLPDRLTQGLRLQFAALDGPEGRRATILSPTVPDWLVGSAGQEGVRAVVVEPIGERGFGFLLSPSVHGRIFLHGRALVGLTPDQAVYGTEIHAYLESGPGDRPRAARAEPAPPSGSLAPQQPSRAD